MDLALTRRGDYAVRVGDVGQGAADDHAPAGPGRLVGRVDLEGDRLPLLGGVELGPPNSTMARRPK
jgi:hypothetical protein